MIQEKQTPSIPENVGGLPVQQPEKGFLSHIGKIGFVLIFVAAINFIWVLPAVWYQSNAGKWLPFIGSVALMYGVIHLALRYVSADDNRNNNQSFSHTPSTKQVIGYTLLAIIIQPLLAVFFPNTTDQPASNNQENINHLLDTGVMTTVWILLFTVALAPVFEEVVFRRILIGRLNQPKIITLMMSIVSVAVFAGMHVLPEITDVMKNASGENITILFHASKNYLALAIIFTFIYVRHRSLPLAICVHIGNNLIASLFMLLVR